MLISTTTNHAVRARAYRENMTNNVLPALAVSCKPKRGFLGTWTCDSFKDAADNASMANRTHSFAGVPESLR